MATAALSVPLPERMEGDNVLRQQEPENVISGGPIRLGEHVYARQVSGPRVEFPRLPH